ncbi:hypothetical protein ACTXT7_008251 [Hymenolepis weldensis]
MDDLNAISVLGYENNHQDISQIDSKNALTLSNQLAKFDLLLGRSEISEHVGSENMQMVWLENIDKRLILASFAIIQTCPESQTTCRLQDQLCRRSVLALSLVPSFFLLSLLNLPSSSPFLSQAPDLKTVAACCL